MPITPPALVLGAPRVPTPFGMFGAVSFRSGTDRWELGATYETLTCDPLGVIGPPEWANTPGLPLVLPKGAPSGTSLPFTVYGHFRCSPIGWTPENAQSRASQHLLAREEQTVEKAFWNGASGNTPSLQGATPLAAGVGVDPVHGLGLLEEFIAINYGSQGVIHLTLATATTLFSRQTLEVRGTKLVTRLGTPVIAGSGYTGTGPTNVAPLASQAWAYGSPALFVYRSDIATSSNRSGDLLDRGVNNLYAVAERTYLLGYDPCGVGAALMTIA